MQRKILQIEMHKIMYKNCFKRAIDFIIVLIVLLLIWPFLLIISIGLHFANKGAGIFFFQERPGKNRKIFKVIKFKTMTDERGADGKLLPDSQRITKIGKLVRSTSVDELPQSAAGKTIMTTEPKFVPKDAAVIRLNQDVEVRIRLIDCVGYMVKGASGHEEAGHERMVKTPWYQEEIPFTKAAVIGTQKVIHEHATIGIVVTTDGTITDILPENYEDAEARTIRELQSIRKPFVVLVNSKKPHGQEAKEKAKKLEDTYGVKAMTVKCPPISLSVRKMDLMRLISKILNARSWKRV